MSEYDINTNQPIIDEEDEDQGGTEGGSALKGSLFLIPPELRHDILQKLKEKILNGVRSTFGAFKIGQRRPDIKPSGQAQAKNPLKKHPLLSLTGADQNVSPDTQNNTDIPAALGESLELSLRLRRRLNLDAKPTKAPPELRRT